MRGLSHRWAARLKCLVPLMPLLALSSCVFIVSTNPTVVSDATIVFVAIDDRGGAVASLRITVVDVSGDWRDAGMTGPDGSFHCTVPAGVTRVRAQVRLPSGLALVGSEKWPHEIDVPTPGTVRVEIRVAAPRN